MLTTDGGEENEHVAGARGEVSESHTPRRPPGRMGWYERTDVSC